jgi:hypothetical protein
MVNLDEVGYLTPVDVDQLIMLVTRPGGSMPLVLPDVPQVGVVGDVDFLVAFPSHTHHITNHGHPVPLRVAMNIKLLVCWLNNQHRLSRVLDMTMMTIGGSDLVQNV